MAPSRSHSIFTLLAILLLISSLAPVHPVTAQEDDVSGLIRLINELRASSGLEPYIVDPGLMALAQEHSEYQASIHTSTHQHSDGRDPPDIGVVENVAGGDLGYLDPYAAVYEVWADPVHQRAILGYPAGSMGVGVADDGVTAYYTLEVRPGGADPSEPGASGTGSAPLLLTPIPLATLVPSTPRSDGSIVHVVGYGQTLWTIALAYGIQVDQIRAWNNLDPGASDIYAGQHLLVLPANLSVPSPTLPAGTVTQQTRDVQASAPVDALEGAATPSPSSSLLAVPDPPAQRPTDAETADGIQASAAGAQTESGLLAPILVGGSLLIGCALLLILRMDKKRS